MGLRHGGQPCSQWPRPREGLGPSLWEKARGSGVHHTCAASQVYKGYVDDPRNTDNAWIETVAVSIHFQDQSDMELKRLNSVCGLGFRLGGTGAGDIGAPEGPWGLQGGVSGVPRPGARAGQDQRRGLWSLSCTRGSVGAAGRGQRAAAGGWGRGGPWGLQACAQVRLVHAPLWGYRPVYFDPPTDPESRTGPGSPREQNPCLVCRTENPRIRLLPHPPTLSRFLGLHRHFLICA